MAPLLLVALSSAPTVSSAIDLAHMQPRGVVELRSTGEPAEALIDLLAPFFAKRHFGYDRARSTLVTGDVVAVFSNGDTTDPANSDAIVAKGKFNCVYVTYYNWRFKRHQDDPNGPGRAATFESELKNFLSTLPHPRLSVTDIAVESNVARENAF